MLNNLVHIRPVDKGLQWIDTDANDVLANLTEDIASVSVYTEIDTKV